MFVNTYAYGRLVATSYARAIKGLRKSMEDTCVVHKVSDTITLLAVFDGHGGSQVADLCKQNVGQVFTSIARQHGCHDMEQNLRRTYAELDDMAYKAFDDEAVGATAAIVLLTPDRVWFSNCGDTMILVNYKGVRSPHFVSENHRVEYEKDRIEAAGSRIFYLGGCWRVDGVLNIGRSIGDHYSKDVIISHPHIASYPLYSKEHALDYILIASDGLWDVFDGETVDAQIVGLRQQHGENIHMVLAQLVQAAYDKGSADNITVLMTIVH